VLGRQDTRPRHGKVEDRDDPLHLARVAEVTSLWRLGLKTTSCESSGQGGPTKSETLV